ncbi:hypothetical protein, partial [Burkholderia contaminans]|uniref:hypothetical protein n=1 Tax=Burkholderia contaminans TaxID=488447 RepID=UPI001CF20318
GLGFLQKPDDLLFRKALLHVRLLLRKRTLLDSGWPCLQGAGHHYIVPQIHSRDTAQMSGHPIELFVFQIVLDGQCTRQDVACWFFHRILS